MIGMTLKLRWPRMAAEKPRLPVRECRCICVAGLVRHDIHGAIAVDPIHHVVGLHIGEGNLQDEGMRACEVVA